MHVFTYGTLMFPEVWQAVVGRQFSTIGGHAAGYAIYRVRDAVYPGIVAAIAAESVRGVVYLEVDPRALGCLDRFEDDFYDRQPIAIICDDGRRLEAEAYVVPTQHRHVLTDEPWSGEAFYARGDLARFAARFAGFRRLSPG